MSKKFESRILHYILYRRKFYYNIIYNFLLFINVIYNNNTITCVLFCLSIDTIFSRPYICIYKNAHTFAPFAIRRKSKSLAHILYILFLSRAPKKVLLLLLEHQQPAASERQTRKQGGGGKSFEWG